MTDEKRVTALLPSKNSENIGTPYGVVSAAIFLGKPIGGELESAAFSVQKGIIECSQTCRVFIRFDDEEPVMLKATHPGAGSYNTVFFEEPRGFYDRLKSAKRIRVQPRLYGSSSAVFEFEQNTPPNW